LAGFPTEAGALVAGAALGLPSTFAPFPPSDLAVLVVLVLPLPSEGLLRLAG
jgi:hypothetical protein